MKREILFRGKSIYTKVWVYGYLTSKNCIEEVEVIPETIGQFTGLTDKNGKKIFIDDTYKDEQDDLFKVVQMKCGRYALQMLDNNYIDEFIDWSEVEIIGNIHDND